MGFLLGLAAIFSIVSGVVGLQAAGEEADAQRDQADIARAEAEREAIRVEKERKAQRAKIAMRFIKGGVTLQGSPLFLIEEQEEEDIEEVGAIRTRGFALQRLGFKRAEITEARGREALIGGLGQGAFIGAQIP